VTQQPPLSLSGEVDRPHQPRSKFDHWFRVSETGSTMGREVRGGFATFFTMAYIIVLNPLIIGTAKDADGQFLGGGSAPNLAAVAAVTALVAGVMTILMGVVGRYPFAIAAGLGINGFLAFSVASQMSWPDAMGLIVLEGVVITLLVLTNFRTAVFHAIPETLKTSIAVGIGLFIALIGFVDAGFVRRSPAGAPLQLGINGHLDGWPTVVFVLGLLIMGSLIALRVRGAILIGIIVNTIIALVVEAAFDVGPSVGADGSTNPSGWNLVVPSIPDKVFTTPDLSLVGQFSLTGAFSAISTVAVLLIVFSLVLADFFDTMGTVVGLGKEGGMLTEKGELPRLKSVLMVDSLSAVAGGVGSSSSNTAYIESAAGIGEGARTGLANVVTGLLFLLAMFVTPIYEIVPFEAATPALVIVGFLMATQIKNIDFSDVGLALPAFLTFVIMPFTYSITNGIGAGFISYVVFRTVQGRAREIHPLMWIVAAAFLLYFAIAPVERLFGV
jgi:adenine/guanine/hypoxanthine permease